ncbi:MAG: hypothetical protein KC503_33975 [Myxococcales bacterium]|nr:hypothetical protein [Myxococcales bacterium]
MRATSLDELDELVQLCRQGKLFEVQAWVSSGKPIAMPENTPSRSHRRNPLRVAMNAGFHSLVEVLLDAGAPRVEGNYNALQHAVDLRRPDLAELLFSHGAAANEVSMRWVLGEWNPEMIDLFISHGGSLHEDHAVAHALMDCIRPAIGVVKRNAGDAEIMRQAEFALRHHAWEGNVKWVSLLLWAGVDPWARGWFQIEDLEQPDDDDDDGEYPSAVEWAASAGHLEVLKLKKLPTAAASDHPERSRLLTYARSSEVLAWLFEQGHRPELLERRGSRMISQLLNAMTWSSSEP